MISFIITKFKKNSCAFISNRVFINIFVFSDSINCDSSQIHILRDETDTSQKEWDRFKITKTSIQKQDTRGVSKEKTFSVDLIREKHKEAYKPWTAEMDDQLTVMYCEGVNIKDVAKHFGRSKGAIIARIKRLELEELY